MLKAPLPALSAEFIAAAGAVDRRRAYEREGVSSENLQKLRECETFSVNNDVEGLL